ncbi:hypothetical protein SAMN05660461_5307 [Chitinophaga ginsengisegetis]|uniref:HNH endonuclease n=1 Tax=Chitinophaga ginsengisegetis TaxID=393003 RepID=A0A1T5PAY1_9BACT|nr:hypothetical protein [Chitinophaga ginsengisegetis]SKD09419.1 hypothetical protein SAMN05660461_5307 [Chitinophaga ginsengisegetis]
MSRCLLCGNESKLVESHIIPDFLYKDVKDRNGKIASVNLKEDSSRFLNKGLFDRNILCAKCDNEKLGSLEYDASSALKNQIYPVITNIDRQFWVKEIHELLINNIDYKRMKLFLLSVLWRCHITNLEFFQQVDVEELEPVIRQMLLDEDPGNEDTFQISMISILDVIGQPLPLIVTPEVIRTKNLRICRFIMGGIAYFINLGGSELLKYKRFTLKKTNNLVLPVFSGMSSNLELISLGIPKDQADFYTFRILQFNGNLIEMAKKGHFNVLINFCCCTGRQSRFSKEITIEFGEIKNPVASSPTSSPKEKLGKIEHKTISVNYGHLKQIVLVNAYVKLHSGNNLPFNLNAFKICLKAVNTQFKGADIGMINIWSGFIGWDFDHTKITTIIDQELKNCRVKLFSPPL